MFLSMYLYVRQGGGSCPPVGVKQTEKHLRALTVSHLHVNWLYQCISIGNGALVYPTFQITPQYPSQSHDFKKGAKGQVVGVQREASTI